VFKYSQDETIDWKNTMELLSLEFSRESKNLQSDYFISCAYSHYLFSTSYFNSQTKKELFINGIVYPSVKYTEEGMNLAIIPQLINDRSIILENVVYFRMERISDDTLKETESKIAKSTDFENNKIEW